MAESNKKVQYRTLCALSYLGERVEKDAVLELSAKDLANINTDYIVLVDAVKEEAKKEEEKKIEEDKKEGSEIDI